MQKHRRSLFAAVLRLASAGGAGRWSQYLVTRAVIDKRPVPSGPGGVPRLPARAARQIERSLALAYRVEKVELDMAGGTGPGPNALYRRRRLWPETAPAVPADSALAPAPDDPQAAFRRTEEIRGRPWPGSRPPAPGRRSPAAARPGASCSMAATRSKRSPSP